MATAPSFPERDGMPLRSDGVIAGTALTMLELISAVPG
jgi:hypothetical protein